jgi:hypothetical protein
LQNRQSLTAEKLPNDLAAAFADFVGEQRRAEAVRERVAARHLRAAVASGATIAGVLLDLAEARLTVTLRLTNGQRLRGRPVLVGIDGAAMSDGQALTYVALSAVATLEGLAAQTVRDGPTGDRVGTRPATFAALVADAATDRPPGRVWVLGRAGPIVGELRAAGMDVLTVRQRSGTTLVALASVVAVEVRG